MNASVFRWIKIFFGASLIFSISFALLAGLSMFWPSLYGWLMTDVWQWVSPNSWLRYIFGGFCIGIAAGALFTLAAWLQQTSSSLLVKTLKTIFVIAGTCVFVFGATSLIKLLIPI